MYPHKFFNYAFYDLQILCSILQIILFSKLISSAITLCCKYNYFTFNRNTTLNISNEKPVAKCCVHCTIVL